MPIQKPDYGSIQTVSSPNAYPKKEQWELLKEIDIPGLKPLGIATGFGWIFVSDTVNSKVVAIIPEKNNKTFSIIENTKAAYVNSRSSKAIFPLVDKDSIFVYTGHPDLYKMEFPVKLNDPTSFDGFTRFDCYVVEKGGNKLYRMKEAEYSSTSTAGDIKLNEPSDVHISGVNLYLSDSGNKSVHVFDMDLNYLRSMGSSDIFDYPTGITSDGSNIFVCDQARDIIAVFNNEGKLLYTIDSNINKPSDIYFLNGRLYVANTEGKTISILSNSHYNKSS